MSSPRIRRPAIAALLAGLLATGGCASGRLAPGNVNPGRDLVSANEIARWPPSSAQRALVAWWRDAQFANLSGFKALIRSRHTPPGTVALLDALSNLTQRTRPTSIVAAKTPEGTRLRVTVTVRQPVGASNIVDQHFTLRVPLQHREGTWRVADGNAWVRRLVKTLLPLTGGNNA